MLAPENTTQLQIFFLGLANYYQSFIPKMHELQASLNQLLKKDKRWEWTTECQAAFEEILTSNLFLSHFKPELDIIVGSDASQYGISAYLLHKMPDGSKQLIAFVSRILLLAEKHYSQIEKKGLSIIYAVSIFHRYLYGRHFTLQTDHKPLITIFGSKRDFLHSLQTGC